MVSRPSSLPRKKRQRNTTQHCSRLEKKKLTELRAQVQLGGSVHLFIERKMRQSVMEVSVPPETLTFDAVEEQTFPEQLA